MFSLLISSSEHSARIFSPWLSSSDRHHFSTCGLLSRWISCGEFLICGALLASSLWQPLSLGRRGAALGERKLVVRLQKRVLLNRKAQS